MSGLTFTQLDLKEDKVKELLDDPAQKYLKNATILALLKRSYNLVFNQIDITVTNQTAVTDAIYAIAAWHSFGTYGQSISSSLQLQDLSAYKANLMFYKEMAEQLAVMVNVDLNIDIEPTLGDPIPIVEMGRSLLDEHDVNS